MNNTYKELGIMRKSANSLSFTGVIDQIKTLHNELKQQAYQSVNTLLTIRNWMIGYYISEYELKGADRAEYGDKLFESLAEELMRIGIPRAIKRELYRFCQFYHLYPQIVRSLTPQLLLNGSIGNSGSSKPRVIRKSDSELLPIVRSLHAQSLNVAEQIITKLSYAHFELLITIESESKRQFYQDECIQGNWSVRQLRRQINSLYYERSCLSTNKLKLSEQTSQNAEPYNPASTIKDPYIFEFLGLKSREVMSESHLEDQLLDKLQEFLLELGHGFCFEARQKRILIGETQFYVDLVFYHRILKCHILVELKLDEFDHKHIGQLNTYVSWYDRNMRQKGDKAPIGILLCTNKDSTLVDYALAGMDNQLFVSKYLLNLPKKEDFQRFIDNELWHER